MIDTTKVTGCRELRFATVDEALRDAATLAEWERAGQLEPLGNWSLGKALGHVAAWASYPYDGYPVQPPWFVRLLGPMVKRRFLERPMPRGYRLPGAEGGTFGLEELSAEEGLARMRRALERLARSAPTAPNPVFGPLTHEEWLRLNLKHAEHHQGFFKHRLR